MPTGNGAQRPAMSIEDRTHVISAHNSFGAILDVLASFGSLAESVRSHGCEDCREHLDEIEALFEILAETVERTANQ